MRNVLFLPYKYNIVNIPRTVVPGSQVGVIMREDCAVARLSCHVKWPVSLGLLSYATCAELILYCAILFWCPVHLIPLSQMTCHLDFLFIMSLQNPQSFIKLHTVITAYILHHTTNVLGHHMGHHQHQTLSQRYVKCFLYRRYTGHIAAPRGDLGLKVLEKPACCIAELLPNVTPT